ncbi:MAG: DNRLRE domain-containing protein [bacterium]
MRTAKWVAALVLISALPRLAIAEDLALTASTTATITAAMGQGRLLLAFPSVSQLQDQWVTNATLSIPLSPGSLTSDLEIEVDGLTRSWAAGATWTSPWTTPGGDREMTLANSAVVPAGTSGGTLTADVTDVVRAVTEGDLDENGFILLPSSPLKVGFSADELAMLSGQAGNATLHVYYRDLRALGYQGGPKALLARKREGRVEGSGHAR